MVAQILCVAEKPAIAKAVAGHLSGGQLQTQSISGSPYVKNYIFDFAFAPPWGNCRVCMTSVIGHLTGLEFAPEFRGWRSTAPRALFEAPVVGTVDRDKECIAANIAAQARSSRALFIWTDCDREGEHIGGEVRQAALRGNSRIEVARARFSNTERGHVLAAARRPVALDERLVNAVAARIELDLRLGAAFTRFQTLQLQAMAIPHIHDKMVVSYGSCQFPTLGFVVDRYFRVRNFVPEPFWAIGVVHERDGARVEFLWDRTRLFDRMSVVLLFERCLTAGVATVTGMQQRPTSKWKPLPLTTVELQKLGSMFLRIDSKKVMDLAEGLYTKGFISYPRTETDQFDKAIDLRALVAKQLPSERWGQYAQR